MLRIPLLVAVLLLPGCITPPSVGPETGPRTLAQGSMSVSDFFAAFSLPAGDPAPLPVGNCVGLLAELNARAWAEAETSLDQSLRGHGRYGVWAMEGAPMAAATDSAAGRSASEAQVTGTNNQEAGVDEADLVKTDGAWTYVVQDRRVYILHSDRVGDVARVATIELGNRSWGGQLLLVPGAQERLVVLTSLHEPSAQNSARASGDAVSSWWGGGRSFTRVLTYDVSDRAHPRLLDETWVEGYNAGARLIDGTAYVAVSTYGRSLPLTTWIGPDEAYLQARGKTWQDFHAMSPDERVAFAAPLAEEARAKNRAILANATLADHLPEIRRAAGTNPVALPIDGERCARFLLTPEGTGRAVTTVLALDADSPGLDRSLTSVLASHPVVYGARDALVLATQSRDGWWFWDRADLDEATDLHWFRLDGLTVEHRGSGRVAGIVQDSFGIDVHDGILRVATTTGQWGRWWLENPEPMASHVLTLSAAAGKLVPLGVVAGLAPGERIWSARFTDDRAYIVTFEQIDPLWILDLADPRAPRILGELEIPGVSTYIHPVSDDTLLTIGYAPGPGGLGLDTTRVQLSLFDVSDPAAPRRAAVLDVSPGNGYSWSSATHEHKAFTYWGALGKLAIPMSVYGRDGQDYRVGLRLVNVDVENLTLRLHGDVQQTGLPTGNYYWGTQVERSYFLGFPGTADVSVYAISRLGVTAWNVPTLAKQGQVAFEPSH